VEPIVPLGPEEDMATVHEQPWIPTRQQLLAAKDTSIPDLLRPGLDVVFVGINPGLYSAAIQHHFGRPGNRFWPALHLGGFSPQLLTPFEERELLDHGCGITNVVARASAAADELTTDELLAGGKVLERKMRRYRPRFVALLGVGAYRVAFGKPKAAVGPQTETLGSSQLWILPNPSGLNAHYQLPDLGKMFAQLRAAVIANQLTNEKE
jgi:double-stranded uracil-DNA glycosylase